MVRKLRLFKVSNCRLADRSPFWLQAESGSFPASSLLLTPDRSIKVSTDQIHLLELF